ncbi:MAG: hypothetical protein ABSH08_06545 [Tepidisphaeraceae bacterium]|jgi:hypothetical protein
MLARTSLAAGFIFLGVLAVGCKNQGGPAGQSSAPPVSAPRVLAPPPAAPSAPQPASAAPVEPDDASLLARKTSEYARDVTPLLGQQPSVRGTPSIVQWAHPATRPAQRDTTQTAWPSPSANQPATLAAAQLKQDDTVPQILPESADQIPPNPHASAPVSGSTDEYEQKLQNLVHDYPRDLGNQLDYQLLRLVRDEPTPDLANVSQLSSEDRDVLLALMDGLSNFRDAARNDGNVMLNRKIQPLLELADRLRSQAQLSIPTVAFCSQVVSYGVYSPMPSSRLPAGRNNDLIVYCEVANFTSIQGNDAIWRTRLRQEMVLYTDTGLAVWPAKSNADVFLDQSRNRRHDFFISRLIRLPSSLAAGKYVLKITLMDEQSNRVVEASAPLEIGLGSDTTDAQPAADHAVPTPTVLSP